MTMAATEQNLKMQCRTSRDRHGDGRGACHEVTKAEVAQVITQEQIDTLPMCRSQAAAWCCCFRARTWTTRRSSSPGETSGAGKINNQMNAYFVDGAENRRPLRQQHAEMPQLAIREFR